VKNKVVSAAEAIAIIRDGDTIAFSGFVGTGTPDELIVALEKRFVETGHPRDLTLVFAAAPGDGKEKGLNRLAHASAFMGWKVICHNDGHQAHDGRPLAGT